MALAMQKSLALRATSRRATVTVQAAKKGTSSTRKGGAGYK